jgi:hypothetical protein
MKSNLLVLLSEIPIKEKVYKNFEIINISKTNFKSGILNDLEWSIEALHYSNFVKNEIEFEKSKLFDKVVVQKVKDISFINDYLLNVNQKVYNYNVFVKESIIHDKNGIKEFELIYPYDFISDSFTFNLISSFNYELVIPEVFTDKFYFGIVENNDTKILSVLRSHLIEHNIRINEI